MKCVIVVNQKLPLGLIANTAAILGMSIGNKVKGIVGDDVLDRDGLIHRGITQVNVPLLKGDSESIHSLRNTLLKMNTDKLFFVDFCDVAQKCRHYDDYRAKLQQTPANELTYLGIAICGPAQQVNTLTGSIGLLR